MIPCNVCELLLVAVIMLSVLVACLAVFLVVFTRKCRENDYL